jgi:hypothetical protein
VQRLRDLPPVIVAQAINSVETSYNNFSVKTNSIYWSEVILSFRTATNSYLISNC